MTPKIAVLVCAFISLLVWNRPASAAKSFDHCQYYVDSVPFVITTPGVWCLRSDLALASLSNSAINILASNTVLDCKDFAVDGTAIAAEQAQWGITSNLQHDVTVRNCDVRGFLYGIAFYNSESRGNSVVDNRLTGNYVNGITVVGEGSLVRGNRILNTGTETGSGATALSVDGSADVIDNMIYGVAANQSNSTGGISTTEFSGHIIGNRIRGLSQGAISHPSVGIWIVGAMNTVVRDNDISGDGLPLTAGIFCRFASGRIKGNVVKGMETPLMECDLGNDTDVSY